jgi:2-polyprenyl-3-methyl-5-hydroxy-6-metoxy-1,4-benzoquinol methylase
MEDIVKKETLTIEHYDNNADAFWQGTKDHDVTQNIDAFLDALPKGRSLNILDFGCGPGRDLQYFKSLGHNPVGLDGSKQFCDMAQQYSSCPTLHQNFSDLDLSTYQFDGVFANASLFHVPKIKLPNVLKTIHSSLPHNGVLFMSNPRGTGEQWQGQRYGHYMELEACQTFLEQAGFNVLQHYYRPEGQPRNKQPWLAIVCQRG